MSRTFLSRQLISTSLLFLVGFLCIARPLQSQGTGSNTQINVCVPNSSGECPSPLPSPSPSPVPSPSPSPSPTPSPIVTPPPSTGGSSSEPSSDSGSYHGPHILRATRVDNNSIRLFFNLGTEPFSEYILFYGYGGSGVFSFSTLIAHPEDGFVTVNDLNLWTSYDFQIVPVTSQRGLMPSNVFSYSLSPDLRFPSSEFIYQVRDQDGVFVSPEREEPSSIFGSQQAPDVKDPAIPETGSVCAVNPTLKNYLLSLTPWATCCLFAGFWGWLCWPRWLIVPILALLIWWLRRLRRRRR